MTEVLCSRCQVLPGAHFAGTVTLRFAVTERTVPAPRIPMCEACFASQELARLELRKAYEAVAPCLCGTCGGTQMEFLSIDGDSICRTCLYVRFRNEMLRSVVGIADQRLRAQA